MELVRLFFIGIVLGVANVIPGVSGGTIAVVFNVYDRLISVITIKIKYILSQWKFWLPLGCGMVVGIIGFSKLLTLLFEYYPMQTNLFFTGIIAGSIPLIIRKINSSIKNNEKTKNTKAIISIIICFVLFLALMIFIACTKPSNAKELVFTNISFPLLCLFLISGFISAVAMIIPGISGSFLLLAVGTYATIIKAVSTLNFIILIPTGVGIIVGLLVGAFLVRVLLAHFPAQTYGSILGLVIGSIFSVLPIVMIKSFFANSFSLLALIASIFCLLIGFFIAWFSSRKS